MSWRNLIVGACAGALAAALGGAAALAANSPPKVDTSRPTPVVYPKTAQQAGEQGTVVVSVYVPGSGGKPERVNVAKSSGYPDLDNAAVETAMNWSFLPAVGGGGTVSDWGNFQIVYKLPQQTQAQ